MQEIPNILQTKLQPGRNPRLHLSETVGKKSEFRSENSRRKQTKRNVNNLGGFSSQKSRPKSRSKINGRQMRD
jgi:hypothetical protein